jgi:hypothetical protein
MLRELSFRVDRTETRRANFEMQMSAGHVAGRADLSNQGSAAHAIADVHKDLVLMAVPDLGSIAKPHDDSVSVGASRPGFGYETGCNRMDRCSGRSREVKELTSPKRPVRR